MREIRPDWGNMNLDWFCFDLYGTENQLKWAEQVRDRVVHFVEEFGNAHDFSSMWELCAFEAAAEYLAKRLEAGFWISRSEMTGNEFLIDALRKLAEDEWSWGPPRAD